MVMKTQIKKYKDENHNSLHLGKNKRSQTECQKSGRHHSSANVEANRQQNYVFRILGENCFNLDLAFTKC